MPTSPLKSVRALLCMSSLFSIHDRYADTGAKDKEALNIVCRKLDVEAFISVAQHHFGYVNV